MNIPQGFIQCKPPYTRYYIRVDGQEIYDTQKEKFINKHKLPEGYIVFNDIREDETNRQVFPRMHRLIALNLIPVPDRLKNIPIEQLQINHIDENPSNNSIDNLEWCTKQENKQYGTYYKRSYRNIHLHRKVLQYDAKTGEFIREYNNTHEPKQYGFDDSGISRCCNGIYKQYKGYIFKYGDIIEKNK